MWSYLCKKKYIPPPCVSVQRKQEQSKVWNSTFCRTKFMWLKPHICKHADARQGEQPGHSINSHLWGAVLGVNGGVYFYLMSGLANCSRWAQSCSQPAFINESLLDPVTSIYLCGIYGCSSLMQQSYVVEIETVWSTKLKIFTIWPITERLCCPLLFLVQ